MNFFKRNIHIEEGRPRSAPQYACRNSPQKRKLTWLPAFFPSVLHGFWGWGWRGGEHAHRHTSTNIYKTDSSELELNPPICLHKSNLISFPPQTTPTHPYKHTTLVLPPLYRHKNEFVFHSSFFIIIIIWFSSYDSLLKNIREWDFIYLYI